MTGMLHHFFLSVLISEILGVTQRQGLRWAGHVGGGLAVPARGWPYGWRADHAGAGLAMRAVGWPCQAGLVGDGLAGGWWAGHVSDGLCGL